MLNFRFPDSHPDDRVTGDRTHPFTRPEDFEALRDRIVKTFRGDADGVLNPLSVTADDFAAFDRHAQAIYHLRL
jgi:hypothetical protein